MTGRERLSQLLAADVLWAGWVQVAVLAGCAVLVAMARKHFLRDSFFYPAFALVASMAVPALGLFVVFAALIAPALWQRAGCGRMMSWLGTFTACAGGLAASWELDAPSGPTVALALSAYGAFSALHRHINTKSQ